MATLAIPTDTVEPYYTLRTRLSDRDYTLKFTYSFREERYYLDILDEEDTPLLYGIKLLCNWRIMRYYHDPRLPEGELMVTSLTSDQTPPKLGELGVDRRCLLTYFEPEE